MRSVGKSKTIAILTLCTLSAGCATVDGWVNAPDEMSMIYIGTRINHSAINDECCTELEYGTEGPKNPKLDWVGSFLLDTLLLPVTLPMTLGVTVETR
ncbi:YceK/YidQ family lipoprotein [Pseudomonas sp. F1_0610]|uniref:YceK/YidQ family lipoprotein n=1 Tax=Pseudomonas sp. F1_0610 TaxID=3114284 RepID=UPI0039C1F9A3